MNLVTVEQVSRWHPDKYADQISDCILNNVLSIDKDAHCGIETMVKGTTVVVGGEIKSTIGKRELKDIVNKSIHDVSRFLGYKVDKIINLLGTQSSEIDNAVVRPDSYFNYELMRNGELGAGDQGVMIGYASKRDVNPHVCFANDLMARFEEYVIARRYDMFKGDAKCQVTYDLDTKQFTTIVMSVCHKKEVSLDVVRAHVGHLISTVIADYGISAFKNTKIIINPTGTWTIGGPIADSGLTGRKLVCDAYGPQVQIGGGAQSGKDFTKVDRTAFYMANYLANVLLHKFDLKEVKVELAYIIGLSHPASVSVKCGSSKKDKELTKYILDNYDLTPLGMIEKLKLDDDYVRRYVLVSKYGPYVLDVFMCQAKLDSKVGFEEYNVDKGGE